MIKLKKRPNFFSIFFHVLIRKLFTFVEKWRWKSYYTSITPRFKIFGNDVILDYGIVFGGEKNISIGDEVFIGRNCIINAAKGGEIFIDKGSSVGANTTMITWNLDNLNNLDLNQQSGKNVFKNISIGKGVGIGYNVTINPGVSIAKGCEIAAGSVVTRSFNEFEIIAGNPAIVIGKRFGK